MRKILLFICLLVSTMMMAGPVDQEAAKQKAQAFIANKMGAKAHRSMKATSSGVTKATNRAATRDYLYVFNIDGGGYVIVSADDRTEEILGYSTTGTFDANKMPDNMRAFLQEYVDGIQYLDDNNIQIIRPKSILKKGRNTRQATNRAPKTSISPLLKTTWDQWAPYALYCPKASNGKLTLTGCVATAMAQVMGYHKWPNATTTDIPAYTSSGTYNIPLTSAGTAIDWANIKNSYTCDYSMTMTESQADNSQKAVARLMQLCGQSVMMNYGTGGSSATTALCVNALIKYFDYDASAQWLLRKNFSYSEWQDIIYAELAANRPVLYDGQSAGGGHAFVCDGYSSDDFFHINWGWSGTSNSYFRLRLLNPEDQGAGGSSTNEGYGVDQGAGIGIKKNAGSPNNYNGLYVTHMASYENTLTRTSTSSDFSLTAYFHFANYSFLSSQKAAFQVLNSSNEVLKTINITNIELKPAYYYIKDWSREINLGSDLPNGTYKIVISSREQDTDDWKICAGCSTNYIEFTISGNTLTIGHGYEKVDIQASAEVSGNGEINSPQIITLTITNNGTAYRHNLSYKINNSSSSYTATYVEVEPGETKSFPFTFSSGKAGTYTLHICNENGEELTTAIVNIGGGSGTANLTGTYNGATPAIQYDSSSDVYYVNGTTTTASFTVKNIGDAEYNNNVVFNYFYYSKSLNEWRFYREGVVSISLAAGASQNFNLYIDKVDDSDYLLYCVEMNWIVNDEETFLATTPDFEFRGASGGDYKLEATDLVGTPSLQYNTDAYIYYINGTESTFSIDITNTGSDDFSGQLKIEQAIHYAGGGNNWYYKDYPTYPETRDVTIPAGSTQRFSTTITKSTDETVDMYFVRMGYKGGNESDFVTLKYTPNFVFVDANTPTLVFKSLECDPPMIWDSEKSIYYVDGQKTKASFSITNVGGGAFDGKIKFIYNGIDSSGKWVQIKSTTTHSFSVAGGATAVATSGTIEKTEGYDKYNICCYYVDPATGTEIFIRRTSDFEFRTGNTIPGDANGDGLVNVTDIVATVNYIMEKPSDGFIKEAADLNGDGVVNVTDIVMMVKIIMEDAARQEADVNKKEEKDNSNAEVGLTDILKEGQVKY